MSSLLGWAFVGWWVAFAVAVGVALTLATTKELRWAKACFWSVAIMLAAKLATYSDDSGWWVVFLYLPLGAALITALRWVDSKNPARRSQPLGKLLRQLRLQWPIYSKATREKSLTAAREAGRYAGQRESEKQVRSATDSFNNMKHDARRVLVDVAGILARQDPPKDDVDDVIDRYLHVDSDKTVEARSRIRKSLDHLDAHGELPTREHEGLALQRQIDQANGLSPREPAPPNLTPQPSPSVVPQRSNLSPVMREIKETAMGRVVEGMMAAVRPTPAQKAPPHPPSLRDHYERDFSGSKAISKVFGRRRIEVTGQSAPHEIEWAVWRDAAANVEFVSYYVARSDFTYEICAALADASQALLAEAKGIKVSVRWHGDKERTNSDDFRFSGRVFLYHEDDMPIEQLASLKATYHERNMLPQFRDTAWAFATDLVTPSTPNSETSHSSGDVS